MLTPQYLLPPPEPFDYCYEWETGYGIVRKFSATPHHGMPPTRTVALYTADQMRAALADHVPESELRAVIDRCYAEFCGRDYMHLPLDEALRAALSAVPAQPVAWLCGDGHPHHISAVQTITERRIYGPRQPLYAAPQAVPVPAVEWKCEAVTADFSDQTITLQMSGPDWYVQAGKYTLIPPAAAPKEQP